MNIKGIEDGEYTSDGKFTFNSNLEEIKINAVDVLKMAYTLFDWAGMDYSQLDEINEKVED